MVTRTEAIKNFLTVSTHPDLAAMYTPEMEAQVNVAQDQGERISDEYHGAKRISFTDGVNTWFPFRIPHNARSEPTYDDKPMTYDLANHAEAIGMTGWNWKQRKSEWVAFDFDSMIGHSVGHLKKLTDADIEAVRVAAFNIPWVTIRKSTAGKGLHLYVMIPGIETKNHTEHAALGRAILGKMSALAGFDFHLKVDVCGGNMWVWARKMRGTDGLTLLKSGTMIPEDEVPQNWRDHVKVVSGVSRKVSPSIIPNEKYDLFEDLCSQRPRTPLDEDHHKLIAYLKETNACWWWDQDHHMLITHTVHVSDAHRDLNLKGVFKTVATGRERGADHNCFLVPIRRGAWEARRYTPGTGEAETWDQDGHGWTRCFLNKDPDLVTACRANSGIEDPKGGFVFREASVAQQAVLTLGSNFNVPIALASRQTKLKPHRDGRLIVEVERNPHDPPMDMQGWLTTGNGPWTKILNVSTSSNNEPEIGNYDDLVRHIVTEQNEDYGWAVKRDGLWGMEPINHIRAALKALGVVAKDIDVVIGSSVFKPWKLVNKPFEPEYPGDRQWNRHAAQLRFVPSTDKSDLSYPSWNRILEHCGKGLDDAIKDNPWAKVNNIKTGAEYLKLWISALFQKPLEPLPYLFFYGPENSGKSIFHEALALLMTHGYKRADNALTNAGSFNAELEGSILCVVEEVNLSLSKLALNRIKDWVTGRDILIHRKGETPYHTPNTTHWVQVSNRSEYCPVFPGDTRITMVFVNNIDPMDLIPKRELLPRLEQEAPDFLAELLQIDIPPSNDRLFIPVVETMEKYSLQRLNETALETFIREKINRIAGQKVKLSSFWEEFQKWLEPEELPMWTKVRIGKELPPDIPKGRSTFDAQLYIGNIWWKEKPLPERIIDKRYVLGGRSGDMLVLVDDKKPI